MSKHLNEQFLDALKYMNQIVKADHTAGKSWRYTNSKKRYTKFHDARDNNRYTNCVSGVQMGLLMIGLPDAITHWYGSAGKIAYTTDAGRKAVKKYFDIIKVNDTVINLYTKGKLCDGDILIYANMNHTNVYYGNRKSFDSGHAYCSSSGELAQFTKWIGALSHQKQKVAVILRFKDRAHYRVQCGAFTTEEAYNETVAKLTKAGYKTIKVEEDGYLKIQVGYFAGKTNAVNYATNIIQKGFPAFIVEVDANE